MCHQFSVTGPIFVILGLGAWLRRIGLLNDAFIEVGSRLVFNVTLPVGARQGKCFCSSVNDGCRCTAAQEVIRSKTARRIDLGQIVACTSIRETRPRKKARAKRAFSAFEPT